MTKVAIVQVYTGDGKGKSTAACGLALRAAAHGLKVGFFRFFKPDKSGEVLVLKSLKNVRVYNPITVHPACQGLTRTQRIDLQRRFARQWQKVTETIRKKKFDLVILDEILIAVRDGFLSEKELVKFLDSRPKKCELVLTGRTLPRKVVPRADLITEMRAVKHPFPALKARQGIEF
ncbi:MAG: cob(I)yrinic acid a,c-diamide adenosyltransferase [Candidatus Omnitrophica bacterium]|nr:cob(I)yrinic acid a,c-diamide adenosyltransferase [Candidatus Omnitrophota bacterium]